MLIVTDSASDITLEEAKQMNIEVVPLAITFDFGVCPQESHEDFKRFFEHLEKAEKLPVTSQPSPESFLKIFERAKAEDEEVLVITLSSGLSGTISGVHTAKSMCDYEKIYIVDSRQAIITQRMLVERAVELRAAGKSAKEIEEEMIRFRDKLYVCGMLDTLKYLKKGGRIPGAMAYLGEVLKIKPMIALKDKVLVEVGIARGRKAAIKRLLKEFEESDIDLDWPVYFGYTVDREFGEMFMMEAVEKYKLTQYKLFPIGGVIGTHVGPNCIALAYVKK